MDLLLLIIGAILVIAGIIGCVIPALPGPPFSFLALLILELVDSEIIGAEFLLIMLAATLIVSVLDYLLPVFGVKIFGISNYGLWASFIGMILGIIFFPPFGMLAGLILGAVLGELVAGKSGSDALKAGFVSFLLNLSVILLKLGLSLTIGYYFFKEAISYLI